MKTIYEVNDLNKDYAEKLSNIITQDRFNEFTDLIIEILLRRQKEFDISEERLIHEAKNLVKRLPEIQIVHKNELSNKNWCAQFDSGGIKIGFEYYSDVLNDNKETALRLYETLTHEIYHLIAMNDKRETGVFNTLFDSRGLNELIDEAAANRASINYSQNEKQYGLRKTYGYKELTLFSPILARSFGVTEREFLSAGISEDGHYSLLKILDRYADKNDSDAFIIYDERAKNYIKTISKQFEMLHNIGSPMNKKQVINERKKPKYRTELLKSIFKTLINLVNFRLINDARIPNKEIVEEYAYSFNEIVSYANVILNEYTKRGLINLKQTNEIKKEMVSQLLELCDRILGINEVARAVSSGKTPQVINEMLFYAKNGKLTNDPDIAKTYEVVRILPQNKGLAISNIDTRRIHSQILENDFRPEYWNNEPVLNMITDIYKVKSKEFIKNKDGVHSKQSIYDQPNNKRFKIRDRVIGFFNIFWNKRKTLGDGDSRYIIH